MPMLTARNREDLTERAENILPAREAHFPTRMPDNLRVAREHKGEVLERVQIGRRLHNGTEGLEKLFAMYAKSIGPEEISPGTTVRAGTSGRC